MKIISLYCLLVNLTSSFKKKKGGGAGGKRLSGWDAFPWRIPQPWTQRCNYFPAYSLRVGRCTGQAQRSQRASLNPFNAGPTDIQITCTHRLTPAARELFQMRYLHVTLWPSSPPSPQSFKEVFSEHGRLFGTHRETTSLILGPADWYANESS